MTMMQETMTEATTDLEIRPFHVSIPEEALADLRRRIAATRWPAREVVTDQSQGVQLATVQKLARYWATDYDWRTCEAKLNALPPHAKVEGSGPFLGVKKMKRVEGTCP